MCNYCLENVHNKASYTALKNRCERCKIKWQNAQTFTTSWNEYHSARVIDDEATEAKNERIFLGKESASRRLEIWTSALMDDDNGLNALSAFEDHHPPEDTNGNKDPLGLPNIIHVQEPPAVADVIQVPDPPAISAVGDGQDLSR